MLSTLIANKHLVIIAVMVCVCLYIVYTKWWVQKKPAPEDGVELVEPVEPVETVEEESDKTPASSPPVGVNADITVQDDM